MEDNTLHAGEIIHEPEILDTSLDVDEVGNVYWVFIFTVTVLFLTSLWLHKKLKRKKPVLSKEELLNLIKESTLFPLHPDQGWSLCDSCHGHRIWQRLIDPSEFVEDANKLRKQEVLGLYTKIQASSQTILDALTDVSVFPSWRLTLQDARQSSPPRRAPSPRPTKTFRAKPRPPETVYDEVTGRDGFTPSRTMTLMFWASNKMRPGHGLCKTYKINRAWSKEENGCCWMLEMNIELEEWTFYLVQPVEKSNDQCMLTVMSHTHTTRHRSPGDRMVAMAASVVSLQSHLVLSSVNTAPLLTMTLTPEKEPDPEPTPESTEDNAETQTPPSKARLIFADMFSKFNNKNNVDKKEEKKEEPEEKKPTEEKKTEEKSSEENPAKPAEEAKPKTESSPFFKKFRSLIEEKREWYEEKKRRAAAQKAAEMSQRANEEVSGILGESQVVNDQPDTTTSAPPADDASTFAPIAPSPITTTDPPKPRYPLVKSKTISCIDEVMPPEGADEAPTSFSEKLRKKLWTSEARKCKSLDYDVDETRDESLSNSADQNSSSDGHDTRDESDLEDAYLELGRETVSELLSLKSKIANIDIKLPYDQQAEKSGGWIYCGLEREVVILRKIYEEGAPMQSYLGKGLIQCAPKVVFETLRNPKTRFTYDDMLKKMEILHEFNNGMKIVHWTHEVSQLFKRETRDFCLVQYEAVEGSKYVISLRSVGWSECAESDAAPRATLHASGWIIEPAPKNNQLFSMVTYIVQMELGHAKSSNGYLVEELAAKQPLSIAFLRQYLVPSPGAPSSGSTSHIPRPSGSTGVAKRRRHSDSQGGTPGGGAGGGAGRTLAALAQSLQEGGGEGEEKLGAPPARC